MKKHLTIIDEVEKTLISVRLLEKKIQKTIDDEVERNSKHKFYNNYMDKLANSIPAVPTKPRRR